VPWWLGSERLAARIVDLKVFRQVGWIAESPYLCWDVSKVSLAGWLGVRIDDVRNCGVSSVV
jgi:hypothetical protein